MNEERILKGLVEDIVVKYLTSLKDEKLKDLFSDMINQSYLKGVESAELTFNMNFAADPNAVNFIKNQGFNYVKDLKDAVKDELRKQLIEGISLNENPADLKKRIAKAMDIGIVRAKTITLTETNKAFNIGHYQGAKDSGLYLKKQWNAQPERISRSGNQVPCPVCEELDGQIVGMNDYFKSSHGNYYLPPVHPNCACRVIYVQPKLSKLKAEAEFNGKTGKWRTVNGRHIFFADDGTSYTGDGKEFHGFKKENRNPKQYEKQEDYVLENAQYFHGTKKKEFSFNEKPDASNHPDEMVRKMSAVGTFFTEDYGEARRFGENVIGITTENMKFKEMTKYELFKMLKEKSSEELREQFKKEGYGGLKISGAGRATENINNVILFNPKDAQNLNEEFNEEKTPKTLGNYDGDKESDKTQNLIHPDNLTDEQAKRYGQCHEKAIEYAKNTGATIYSSGNHTIAVKDGMVYDYVLGYNSNISVEEYLKIVPFQFIKRDLKEFEEKFKRANK